MREEIDRSFCQWYACLTGWYITSDVPWTDTLHMGIDILWFGGIVHRIMALSQPVYASPHRGCAHQAHIDRGDVGTEEDVYYILPEIRPPRHIDSNAFPAFLPLLDLN